MDSFLATEWEVNILLAFSNIILPDIILNNKEKNNYQAFVTKSFAFFIPYSSL